MKKELFEKWLYSEGLSPVTVGNYMRGIRYTEEKFPHLGTRNKLNIYEIDSVKEIELIIQDTDFKDYDKKGNRMCSSGLKKYKEFLSNEIPLNGKVVNMQQDLEDIVLIKINQSYKVDMTPEELYRATSISWVGNFKKTSTRDLKYYCAIVQNKIIEVYDFLGYEEEIPKRDPARYILHGKVSNEELRGKLLGLDISEIHKGSGNPIKYTNLYILLQLNKSLVIDVQDEVIFYQMDSNDFISNIYNYISSKGFTYSLENIKNLYLSLRSKPFVIISGISGTGKTKIVQMFAESIGATEENGRFKLIPVRPDWSDSSDLLGYLTLQEEYKKGPLAEIVEHAMNYPEFPHFALLDEMNLARVEYYFSDVLSVMESRKKGEDGRITSSPLVDPKLYQKEAFGESPEGPLRLPNNLYIIGTVNMDETTHPFSKKVLDRANTIEFNQIELSHFDFLTEVIEKVPTKVISNENLEASYIHLIDVFSGYQDLIKKISRDLEAVNMHLMSVNAQVGYRVRDEICFYMVHNLEANLLSEDEAMDFCYMQKVLPRISGGQVVRSVLIGLKESWTVQTEDGLVPKYPKSIAKVEEMLGRLDADGFTSFWIA